MRLLQTYFFLLLFFLSSIVSAETNINQLNNELTDIQLEIRQSRNILSENQGNLIGQLTAARLNILLSSESLIKEWILVSDSGANIEYTVHSTTPNTQEARQLKKEITTQQQKIKLLEGDLSHYSNGLLKTVTTATISVEKQTLAMLNQKYLIDKYGLLMPSIPFDQQKTSKKQVDLSKVTLRKSEYIHPKLLYKTVKKSGFKNIVTLNIAFTATRIGKPTKSIEGILKISDHYNGKTMRVNWDIPNHLNPGDTHKSSKEILKYNRVFGSSDIFSQSTEDLMFSYEVKTLIYEDGTRQDI